jgi:hypothetical protein
MHRGIAELPILGTACHRLLGDLCAEGAERERIIEEISALIVAELTVGGLSDSESDFLVDHAFAVQKRVKNEAHRNLPVMVE